MQDVRNEWRLRSPSVGSDEFQLAIPWRGLHQWCTKRFVRQGKEQGVPASASPTGGSLQYTRFAGRAFCSEQLYAVSVSEDRLTAQEQMLEYPRAVTTFSDRIGTALINGNSFADCVPSVVANLQNKLMSEFKTHGQNDSGICPPSIEDVSSKIHFLVGEACEKASLHIKRRLICARFLRSQPDAKPVGRRVG